MATQPTLRLQAQPTPFIGRERQVAQVCALLGKSAGRLLTLAGPGGIGKTRLALAVADALQGEYPDGIFYVPLATLADANLVVPAIAQALDMRESGTSTVQPPLIERLQDAIGQRKLLLVLDNFEQVVGGAADIAALLSGCPRLKILVTSREVLRVSAEQCYDVPPLALPDLQHLPPLEFLARIEAIRLFVARAQAVQADFELTPANGMAVATICHRLDGLPLAIELAAARIRLLPPVAMLARLERRLTWLAGGGRDVPARHQTLRDAVGWSYDLLEPGEQQLFRRLAVFVGGCTPEAVAALYNAANVQGPDSLEEELLKGLASLLHKSLLREDHTGSEQGRLYMLETIREYALEQLAASGEAEAMCLAHAQYYLTLAEEAETGLTGSDQLAWFVRLEEEHDNLRAALGWALGGADIEMGARLAVPLWRFWLTHGHLTEGRRWLEAVLASKHSLPAALRARALNAAGRLALRQGDYVPAQSVLTESLALWCSLDDKAGEMQTLDNLGLMGLYQNDLAGARRYLEQSLAGWRSLGDKQGVTNTLNRLGLVLRYQEDFEQAAKIYEECVTLSREVHDKYPMIASRHNLGQMAHHQGDDKRAHRLLTESLVLVRQFNDKPNISVCLADLAGVWATQGQPLRAARLFGASEAMRENMQVNMYEAQRLAYERDVERGAAQVDPAEWKAAWAEGRNMPIDEACALAMEVLPDKATAPERHAIPTAAETYNLSERELEVLRLLVDGLTYAAIAEHLTLSFHTVHAHLRSIYSKLGVTSRSQATRFATEHRLA